MSFGCLPVLISIARMLRKNVVVTGAAVLSLSLALGACVAAFSLVDALILQALPVRQELHGFVERLPARTRDAGRRKAHCRSFNRFYDGGFRTA